MEFDKDYLEECANIILKAQSYLSDDDLMKQVQPIIDDLARSADQLKDLSYKSLIKLANEKALEEQEAAEKIRDEYYRGDEVVLGEKGQDYKIPGKA